MDKTLKTLDPTFPVVQLDTVSNTLSLTLLSVFLVHLINPPLQLHRTYYHCFYMVSGTHDDNGNNSKIDCPLHPQNDLQISNSAEFGVSHASCH